MRWHTTTPRGRRYVLWACISKGSVIVGLAAALIALSTVSSLVISALTESELERKIDPALMFLWMAGLAVLSIPAYAKARERAGEYLDRRFDRYGYPSVLASLHRLGVEQPVRYLEENEPAVEAYLRVLRMARFRIGLSNHEQAKERPFRRWKPSDELLAEHLVASLVLPGPDELNRELRIEHLLKDRGLRTYDEIRGLLEHGDDQPLTLTEGAL